MKGVIIAIEGSDGSGKETQSKKLFQRLKEENKKVSIQKFPNDESISSGPVKMYLNGEFGKSAESLDAYQSSALFAVDRLCTVQKLKQKYDNGEFLIFDRYTYSNMIHQGTKFTNIKERDNFIHWVNEFEFGILKLPRADIIFYLDVPSIVSKEIINERKNSMGKNEKLDVHENDNKHIDKSHEVGKMLAEKFGWEKIRCVDSNGARLSIDEIHKEIYQRVKKFIGKN